MVQINNPADEVGDDVFRIVGSADATKKLAFEVDGLTTATTRTLTVQDIGGTLPLLGGNGSSITPQTWTGTGNIYKCAVAIDVPNSGALNIFDALGSGGYVSLVASVPSGAARLQGFQDSPGTIALIDAPQTWSGNQSGMTLITPTIASFANATHTHLNAAGGGTLTGAAIAASTWSTLQKFPDNDFQIIGSATASKVVVFEVDGLTAATTRTLTVPDASGTLALINATQTITGPWTFGSGAAVFGQDAGDEVVPVFHSSFDTPSSRYNFAKFLDASNSGFTVTLRTPSTLSASQSIDLPNGSGELQVQTNQAVLTNKRLSSNSGAISYLNMGVSATTSLRVANGSSTTLYQLWDLSSLTGARTMKWSDEAGRVPVVGTVAVTTGANATTLVPGKVDTGSIGTDFAQAQIVTTASVGLWLLTSYLECTVSSVTGGAMITTWGWTDDNTTQSDATQTTLLTTTALNATASFSRVVKVASGHITIKCLVNGTGYGTTGKYTLTARAQFLG